MILSRCIACQKDYPQNAPAFCACGGSTFTTLHLADDEPPTTSPEGRGLVSGATLDPSSAPKPGAADGSSDEPETDDDGDEETDDDGDELGGTRCRTCGEPATHGVTSLEGAAFVCRAHADELRNAGVEAYELGASA